MLTYMSDCKGEWRNYYQWRTSKFDIIGEDIDD